MSKVKVNLTNGSVLEKPLVTCFKGTNGNYIVLDNETNGSMGLPIICISKFNGTSAEKIFDQAEWASVKENLKTIIAGTALPYLNVPETITASDDFFTQLTLPVASFDLLKSVYAPVKAEPETPVVENAVVETPEVAAPMATAPEVPAVGVSSVLAPAPIIAAPVETVQTPSVEEAAPVIETPVINPVIAAPEVAPQVTESVVPVVDAPVVDVVPTVIESQPTQVEQPEIVSENSNLSNADILTMKDMFMKSCENMFDALVKKFENK